MHSVIGEGISSTEIQSLTTERHPQLNSETQTINTTDLVPNKLTGHKRAGINGLWGQDGEAPQRTVGESLGTPWLTQDWRPLFCWTMLAFLIRLALVLGIEQVITPDGTHYVARSQNLMAGDFRAGFSPYVNPLFPVLVGLSSIFFPDAEFAGRFVSVLAGSLLVIPTFKIIRIWYGPQAALLGACMIALHPLLIYYSSEVLTESSYTLVFTFAVLAGWYALTDGRARFYIAAGATLGLCYLLKPEAAAFLLVLLAPILAQKLFNRAVRFRTSIRNALLLCASFMLLAAPYLFYLRSVTGAWMISGKMAGHMWQGSRRAGDRVIQADPSVLPDFATILVQLTKALRLEFEIFNLIFPPLFVLLVGLCLFRKPWTGERARRELYLFSFIAATLAGYAVTLPNIRYIMPLLPILLCWVSQGILEIGQWTTETLLRFRSQNIFSRAVSRLFVPLVVACLLATLLPLALYLFRGDKWGDHYGQKRAAIWIKEREVAPAIMSTVEIPSHYARGRHVALVDEDYTALIERARREGVTYIVVNERDFKLMNPSLRPLLDEQSQPAGLRRVYHSAESPGHKIMIYMLEKDESGRS